MGRSWSVLEEGLRQNLRGALRGVCPAASGFGRASGGDIAAGLQRRQGKRKRRGSPSQAGADLCLGGLWVVSIGSG